MKVKLDFVTNSSSTAYIILNTNRKLSGNQIKGRLRAAFRRTTRYDEFEEDILFEEFVKFSNVESFQLWNNEGKPLDWVEKATGLKRPRMFTSLYRRGLEELNNKNSIIYFVTDNSIDISYLIKDIPFLQIIGCESC